MNRTTLPTNVRATSTLRTEKPGGDLDKTEAKTSPSLTVHAGEPQPVVNNTENLKLAAASPISAPAQPAHKNAASLPQDADFGYGLGDFFGEMNGPIAEHDTAEHKHITIEKKETVITEEVLMDTVTDAAPKVTPQQLKTASDHLTADLEAQGKRQRELEVHSENAAVMASMENFVDELVKKYQLQPKDLASLKGIFTHAKEEYLARAQDTTHRLHESNDAVHKSVTDAQRLASLARGELSAHEADASRPGNTANDALKKQLGVLDETLAKTVASFSKHDQNILQKGLEIAGSLDPDGVDKDLEKAQDFTNERKVREALSELERSTRQLGETNQLLDELERRLSRPDEDPASLKSESSAQEPEPQDSSFTVPEASEFPNHVPAPDANKCGPPPSLPAEANPTQQTPDPTKLSYGQLAVHANQSLKSVEKMETEIAKMEAERRDADKDLDASLNRFNGTARNMLTGKGSNPSH